ncbi:MAG TPA: response regulator [Terriglobia bacterium]|jgi:DNA-binding NtrC family response regulator|nr:response regulator [Terriglobia bacterium]
MHLETVMRPPAVISGSRVLLVDESPDSLAHLYALLRSLGCEVWASVSYAEGVKCLEARRWDFVLVSQGTCAFEGRCVLERAMEIDRYIPVVVFTRWHHIPCYLTAMHLGAVDYLEEPLTLRELARVLETHLPPRTGRRKSAQRSSVNTPEYARL